jgi:hypothetical protein
MNAIEFQTTIHDGLITLPQEQLAWNGKKIRVILLEETDVPEFANDETAAETDFFECAGMWEQRDITQASLRAEAWREHNQ